MLEDLSRQLYVELSSLIGVDAPIADEGRAAYLEAAMEAERKRLQLRRICRVIDAHIDARIALAMRPLDDPSRQPQAAQDEQPHQIQRRSDVIE